MLKAYIDLSPKLKSQLSVKKPNVKGFVVENKIFYLIAIIVPNMRNLVFHSSPRACAR